MRIAVAIFALGIIAVLGLVLASPSTEADGTCGVDHGETAAHSGHRDGDGDGNVCDGHSGPSRTTQPQAQPQPAVYSRADWQYDSSAARTLLACEDWEHVDHVVALKEAHDSGGANWSPARKRVFANDFDNLWCLDGGLNIAKSDGDLAEWRGGSCDIRKQIAEITLEVKKEYGLAVDLAEGRAISDALDADCVTVALEALGIEVRINARRLANGQVEFALQYRLGGGDWSDRILPRARKLPVDSGIERWLNSSPIPLP